MATPKRRATAFVLLCAATAVTCLAWVWVAGTNAAAWRLWIMNLVIVSQVTWIIMHRRKRR